MFLLVYTLSLRIGDVQVNIKFYHRMFFNEGLRLHLLRRQLVFKRLHKGECSRDNSVINNYRKNIIRKTKFKRAFKLINLKKNTSKNVHKTKYHQVDLVTSGNILQVKDETSPAQLDVNTTPDSPSQKTNSDNSLCGGSIFNASWGPQQTSLWLQANRYSSHLTTLSSYSGIDLLRLSKDNLTQLCGLPDGIRLYNALHSRTAVLTIYVCIDIREQVYQAVYLSSCTSNELIHKMSAALGLSVPQIAAVYVRGPNNIKIIITDELVTHLPDQSAYTISVFQDGPDKYQLLLKLSEQRISSDSIPSA